MERDSRPRILLVGGRRVGKSSIQRVVFHKMSPHETLFLTTTAAVDVRVVASNQMLQFQVWDVPGDVDLRSGPLCIADEALSDEAVFSTCGCVVFVIDAQDTPYSEPIARLVELVQRVTRVNPSVYFAVFVHKVDGEFFVSDESKADCQREVASLVGQELRDAGAEANIAYFLTSIYDHSVFEAFSKVAQRLVPQLPTVQHMLNALNAVRRHRRSRR